jgi:hypothetical protein
LVVVGYWQTLATGVLAVLAAFGTIWATVQSANREIKAANDQVAMARRQIETMLILDRKRDATERSRFLIALGAAARAVIASVAMARQMVPPGPPAAAPTPLAYQGRQRVLCPLFSDLRGACVRLGGDITLLFVTLDQDITAFSANWIPDQSINGLAHRVGDTQSFHSELDRIENMAKALLDTSGLQNERCEDELQSLSAALERGGTIDTTRPERQIAAW